MAIDLTQFYQIFFDETEEHLASIESLLLDLDLAVPDAEAINALFRAVHSIKGSAATFGFQEMAALSHGLESRLDRVRKRQQAFSPALREVCLEAGDVLHAQLDAYRAGQPADPAAGAALLARLDSLDDAGEGSPAGIPPAPAPVAPAQAAPTAPGADDGRALREVSFEASPRAQWDRRPVDGVIDELRSLGFCEVSETPPGGVGPGVWRLRVDVPVDDAELREICAYAADETTLKITSTAPACRDVPAAAAGTLIDDADDLGYGFFEPFPEPEPVPAPDAPGTDRSAPAVEPGPAPLGNTGAPAYDPSPAVAAAAMAGQEAGGAGSSAPADPPAARPAASRPEPVAEARGEGTIRIGVERVDALMNLVGELVITGSMLQQAVESLGGAMPAGLFSGLELLGRNTRDLQDAVMAVRMLPVATVFSRFPRLVHDLCRSLGKDVVLQTRGEETELDKGLIEQIGDPLVHLLRNAMDHGIESAAQRRAAGKPERGTIVLSACQRGGAIQIEVSDDGAGLDRERILAKAREQGLASDDTMNDAEVWQLIFEPGFSTAREVTDISGRGVGMDVVRRSVQALGGRIEVHSVRGAGTRFRVLLPLTLAIVDGMGVAVGGERYILPLAQVVESLQVLPGMIREVAGRPRLIELRGEYVPVLELGAALGVPGAGRDWCRGIMVVVQADGHHAALFVDALIGQQQVVIKSLESHYHAVDGVSGATILGDGRVALILDVPALVAKANGSETEIT